MRHIVVWDPEEKYWDGAIVTEEQASTLRAYGAVLLPVSPELFKRSGCGGYAKRSWGSGWPLDYSAPTMCAPICMFIEPGFSHLAWAARLIPDPQLRAAIAEGKRPAGVLRLTPTNAGGFSLRTTFTADTTHVGVANLGELDEFGGWTARGEAKMQLTQGGYYEFALYGAMPGVRVGWVAATASGGGPVI